MRIFITGFMGSGKSSLGRRLANELDYEFLDTDILFEERFHMSIPNFFDRFGEEKFRELEHKILTVNIHKNNIVLSTGGGTPCFYDHMKLLKDNGTVVYIKMGIDDLFERLKQSRHKWPLISKENVNDLHDFIEEKLRDRAPIYEQAHVTVDGRHINAETLATIVLQPQISND